MAAAPPLPELLLVRPEPGAGAFPFRVRFRRLHLAAPRDRHEVGPHVHGDHELMRAERGRYRCRINGEEVRLRPGEVALIGPGDRHQDLCQGPVSFISLGFQLLPGPQLGRSAALLDPAAPLAARILRDPGEAVRRCAERIAAEAARGDPFSTHLQDAAVQTMLWELVRALPPAALAGRLRPLLAHHGFVADLMRAVAAQPERPLGLAALARQMGLSPRTLSARCRTAFACPPTRLVLRWRMDLARDLVAQTGRPLAEVAASLGFRNPFHFSRVYKRVHGVPPSAHREALR